MLLCSQEAIRAHVRPGMRSNEARAVCSRLILRQYDKSLYMHSQKELLAELIDFSPRVSAIQVGTFLLDAGGRKHLGGESRMCRSILRFVSTRGFTDGVVGVADSAFAAKVAAHHKSKRWYIVSSGSDREFLSKRSISYLPITPELRDTLSGLGIKEMGQFLQLSAAEILQRFGNDGLRAFELASGIDHRQPMLPRKEKLFESSLDIGGPIESLNDALFMIKAMLVKLTSALEKEGLCAEELIASFFCDDELIDERPIKLIRPSNDGKFLLEVLRLSLENKKLKREFSGMRLVVSRVANESWAQLPTVERESAGALPELSGNRLISSQPFMLLLQKVTSRLGESAFVYPVGEDQYIPEMAGGWRSVAERERGDADLQVSMNYASDMLGSAGLVAGLVLKKHKIPVPVLVEFSSGKPSALTYRERRYSVARMTEPECLSGVWWEAAVRKSYYCALLSSERFGRRESLLVMLVYDHERSGWFVEGVYD